MPKPALIVAPSAAAARAYARKAGLCALTCRIIINPDQLQGFAPENVELHYVGVPDGNVGGLIVNALRRRGFRDNDARA